MALIQGSPDREGEAELNQSLLTYPEKKNVRKRKKLTVIPNSCIPKIFEIALIHCRKNDQDSGLIINKYQRLPTRLSNYALLLFRLLTLLSTI